MTSYIDQLRNQGMLKDQINDVVMALRKEANAAGMIDTEFNDRLGISDFDTSPIQEFMVNAAKNVFGEGAERFTKEVFTLDDFAQAGFNYSTGSLAFDAPTEKAKQAQSMNKSVLQSSAEMLGMITGDIPAGVAGFFAGGGTALAAGQAGPQAFLPEEIFTMPIGAMAGSFALPEVLRSAMLDAYENGDIDSPSRAWDVITNTSVAGLKAYITGLSAGIAGKVVAPAVSKATIPLVGAKTSKAIKYAAVTEAEVAAFSAVGPALEGRLPSVHDFAAANIAIFGMKAGISGTTGTYRAAQKKIEKVFEKTGTKPDELSVLADRDVTVREDLASDTQDVPRAMQSPEQRAEATDTTWIAGSEKTLEWKDKAQQDVYNPPETAFGELSFKSIIEGVKESEAELGQIYNRILAEHNQVTMSTASETLMHRYIHNDQAGITRMEDLFFDLQEPLVVYRGTSDQGISSTLSTSLSPEIAANATGNQGTLFRITLPAGTRVAMPSKVYSEGSLRGKLEVIVHPDENIVTLREATSQLENTDVSVKVGDAAVLKADAQEAISSRIGTELPTPSRTFKQTIHDFYTRAFDDLHPLSQATKALSEGRELPASRNPYTLARLYRGVQPIADSFLEFGALDFAHRRRISMPLREILRPIEKLGAMKDFQTYMVARRALELSNREVELPSTFTRANLISVVNMGREQFGEAFKQLREYQTNVLKYLRDSGVLNKETFDIIQEANRDYVPFNRVFAQGEENTGSTGLRAALNPIKRIRGSGRDIVNPIESIIRNTYMLVTLAERNRVMSTLVDLQKQNPENTILTPKKAGNRAIKLGETDFSKMLEPYLTEGALKDLQSKISDADFTVWRKNMFIRDNDVVHMENGKAKIYEVQDVELAQALSAMDRDALSAVIKVLAVPSTLLRTGAILSPDFMARNAIRDTLSATVFSRDGFIPVYDTFRGMGHIIGRTQLAKDWAASGGMFSHMQAIDARYMQKGIKDMLRNIPVRNVLKNPIEQLRMLSGLVEQGTRVAAFDRTMTRALKEGKSRIDALTEAGFESRDISIDFQRFGSYGRAINSLSVFFNAFIQGQDKLVREIKNRPIAMTAKMIGGIAIPSALLHLANHDKEWYKDLPDWQRDLYWHFGVGEGKDFTIYRVPKPFELGLIFGTGTERMIEWAMSQDPDAGVRFIKSAFKSLTPNLLPVVMQVPIEMKQNRSIFFDRPIIPRDRENLLPEYQHSVYTTEIAKGLSQLLVQIPGARHLEIFSPAMIEHAVRGFTGGLGAYALDYSDKALKMAGILPDDVIPPAKTMADYPVVKAFVARYPSMSTRSIEDFYKEYNSLNEFNKSLKAAFADMDVAAAEDIFKEQQLTGNLITLEKQKQAIGNLSKLIRNIHKLPMLEGMSKEQLQQFKREQIDNYYLLANQIAKAGVDLAKMSRKQLKLDEE
tara:strand:- start:2473 stop:6765 length:4293 start_codon:yes stop_codon:yes gene_type:complete